MWHRACDGMGKEANVIINRSTGNLSAPAWIAIALSVIGALNWGLVGLFKFDLVAAIFGPLSPMARVVYVIVAMAGLFLLFAASQLKREVSGTSMSEPLPRRTVP